MKLGIAITTAPRDNPTLSEVLDTMRSQFDVHVFAEPGVNKIGKNFHKNKKKLGCFGNWVWSLQEMVDMGYDIIWINQDDMVLCDMNMHTAIDMFREENDKNIVNMYTSIRQNVAQGTVYKKNRNINNRGWNTRGASFMMSRDQAIEILKHPLIKSHSIGYQKNQQLDSIVSAVIKDLGYTQRYFNPSFTKHIGKDSTVEHADFYVNQRLDAPAEPIYAYVIGKNLQPYMHHQFDIIKYYGQNEIERLIQDITHTPGYGFILSDKLAYSDEYVIQAIHALKKNRKNVLTYRYYTINSMGIDEKPAHIFNNDNKPVQFTHYGAIAFHGTALWDKKIFNKQHKDLSYTLSTFFQENNIPLYAIPHGLGIINYLENSYDDERYNTDAILKYHWRLVI